MGCTWRMLYILNIFSTGGSPPFFLCSGCRHRGRFGCTPPVGPRTRTLERSIRLHYVGYGRHGDHIGRMRQQTQGGAPVVEQKTIAVVGATGAQGGGLARAILNDPSSEFQVRAITRKVNSLDRPTTWRLPQGRRPAASDLVHSLADGLSGLWGQAG